MANLNTRLQHEQLPPYQRVIEEFLQNNNTVSAVQVAAALVF